MVHQVQVRCCCEASKLLGWVLVDVPVGRLTEGVRASFITGGVTAFRRYLYEHQSPLAWTLATPTVVELVLTSWGEFTPDGNGIRGGLAFKADGVPLEQLRKIPSFVENR